MQVYYTNIFPYFYAFICFSAYDRVTENDSKSIISCVLTVFIFCQRGTFKLLHMSSLAPNKHACILKIQSIGIGGET